MDIGSLIGAGSAIVGQVAHIVKKKVEEKKDAGIDVDEIGVFKQWILKRPLNSLGAILGAIAASHMIVVPGTDILTQVMQGFAAGFAANSAINRPGK